MPAFEQATKRATLGTTKLLEQRQPFKQAYQSLALGGRAQQTQGLQQQKAVGKVRGIAQKQQATGFKEAGRQVSQRAGQFELAKQQSNEELISARKQADEALRNMITQMLQYRTNAFQELGRRKSALRAQLRETVDTETLRQNEQLASGIIGASFAGLDAIMQGVGMRGARASSVSSPSLSSATEFTGSGIGQKLFPTLQFQSSALGQPLRGAEGIRQIFNRLGAF